MPSASSPSPPQLPARARPSASIVVPTRGRLDYLRVALASIAPQAAAAGAELLVVDDAGESAQTRRLADRFGARYEAHSGPLGLNVARNTGVAGTAGDLVVFVDDDVEVDNGWLEALLRAAREHPSVDVFTGPIRPRLEGHPPRSCGREGAPITALDLGPHDTPTRFAWGANMTIRRAAFDRVGPFDESLEYGGDEQEWQERLASVAASEAPAAVGPDLDERGPVEGRTLRGPVERGPVLYVADAALEHRRSAADARLRSLCRAAHARGRASRRFDVWRGQAPSRARELLTLAGCVGHVLRRRCPAGLTMVAHSSGRLQEALGESLQRRSSGPAKTGLSDRRPFGRSSEVASPPADDFLSGESGEVGGLDGLRRTAFDFGADALEVVSGRRVRLHRAAQLGPTRNVLVLGVLRAHHQAFVDAIRSELMRSRHDVQIHFAPAGDLGKFENLNRLLAAHPPDGHDWLLAVDDDIVLPRGFLDRFVFLAERFSLDLAQPAHRLASHAAWRVTRRHSRDVVRETRFVEIGPLTAFALPTCSTLLPFPELRMGWGLDLHWAALARANGWRSGVIDATPIAHRASPAASAYSRDQALAEARAFLVDRPYLSAGEVQQTLVTHRHW